MITNINRSFINFHRNKLFSNTIRFITNNHGSKGGHGEPQLQKLHGVKTDAKDILYKPIILNPMNIESTFSSPIPNLLIIDKESPKEKKLKEIPLGLHLAHLLNASKNLLKYIWLKTSEYPEIAQMLQVNSIPSCYLISGGRVIDRIEANPQTNEISSDVILQFFNRIAQMLRIKMPSVIGLRLEEIQKQLSIDDLPTETIHSSLNIFNEIYNDKEATAEQKVSALSGNVYCNYLLGNDEIAKKEIQNIKENYSNFMSYNGYLQAIALEKLFSKNWEKDEKEIFNLFKERKINNAINLSLKNLFKNRNENNRKFCLLLLDAIGPLNSIQGRKKLSSIWFL